VYHNTLPIHRPLLSLAWCLSHHILPTRNFWSFHHHQTNVMCVTLIFGQNLEPKVTTMTVLLLSRPWSLVCDQFLNITFFSHVFFLCIYRTSITFYQVYNTKIKFVFNPPHPPHPAPPQSPPPPPFEISAHSPAQSIQPSK
jgi:hypothetical protein